MNLFKLMATISLDDKAYQQGINKAEKSTTSLGDTLKKVALGGTVAGIGKASIKMGMDFESSMSQVAATMGMTSDQIKNGDESFKALEKAAKDAGSTTQFSATQSAEALNYLALAGYDAETSIKMLPKVLNLAAAGGMDLGRASDMVTDSMSALGLEVSEADRFMDEMAKTSQKSNTNVSQLGEAILTVGGTAKVLKGGTVEMNAQLGILADNGIKGAEGGTALRNVILSLSAPTDKAAGKLKKLGINVFDASGNMRETNVIFAEMDKALGKLSQEEKTQALNDIFNKVDLKSVNALLANSGDRFNNLSKEIKNSKDAASNMAETMNANLKGSITTLKSSLEGLAIAIFGKFKEPLTNAINTVVELFQGFIKVLESGKIDWLLGLIAVSLGAIITNMLIMKAISIVTMIVSFVKTIVVAASMVKSLSGAFAILNSVMMANPIGIVVGLIVGLVAAIVYLWNTSENFRNFVMWAWESIKNGVSAAIDWISEKIVWLSGKMKELGAWLKDVFTRDWSETFGAIGNLLNAWLKNIGNVLSSVKQFFGGIIDFIAGVFTGDWTRAWQGIQNIFGGIMNGLVAVMKAPLNAVIGLINMAIDGLNSISFTAPDWVPFVGGKHFGINLPKMNYLYNGGIVTEPTLLGGSTVVGDKYKGRGNQAEVVVPLNQLIRWIEDVASRPVSVEIDGREAMRALSPYQNEFKEYSRFMTV